jgi:hypothetical protein
MKIITAIVSALALAVIVAAPADAAARKKRVVVRHAAVQRTADTNSQFQGGVLKGPLYNGPDYLGDDPDPNIRAGLLKDRTRYQGSY